MYCGERSLVKFSEAECAAVSLRCRSWTCPNCEPTRKAQLIAQGIRGKPNRFLTLTKRVVPHLTAEQAAREISRGWRLLRLRLMRHYKLKRLPFLAVMEKTKAGWPHLHILINGPFLSQKLMSQWAKEIYDGERVWIEHLDKSHKAVIYCSKYCGKAADKFNNAKRYWQSRDYQQNPKTDKEGKTYGDGTWSRDELSAKAWARHWAARGREIKWLSVHMVIATWPDTS